MSSADTFSFSCPNNPKCLSVSSQERCFSLLIIWTHLNRSTFSFFLRMQSWTQHCRWAKERGRIPSFSLLPTLLLLQPKMRMSGLGAHTQLQLFIHDSLQVLLHRAFNVFFSQSLLISQIALTQVQYLPAGLVECYEVLKDPFLELFPGWHFFLLHRFLHSWHQNSDTITHFPVWVFILPFAQQVCRRLTLAEWD